MLYFGFDDLGGVYGSSVIGFVSASLLGMTDFLLHFLPQCSETSRKQVLHLVVDLEHLVSLTALAFLSQ